MYHISNHSSVDGHLGSLHGLAVVDNAAINLRVHVSLQVYFFVSFGKILHSAIAGSSATLLKNLNKKARLVRI